MLNLEVVSGEELTVRDFSGGRLERRKKKEVFLNFLERKEDGVNWKGRRKSKIYCWLGRKKGIN